MRRCISGGAALRQHSRPPCGGVYCCRVCDSQQAAQDYSKRPLLRRLQLDTYKTRRRARKRGRRLGDESAAGTRVQRARQCSGHGEMGIASASSRSVQGAAVGGCKCAGGRRERERGGHFRNQWCLLLLPNWAPVCCAQLRRQQVSSSEQKPRRPLTAGRQQRADAAPAPHRRAPSSSTSIMLYTWGAGGGE